MGSNLDHSLSSKTQKKTRKAWGKTRFSHIFYTDRCVRLTGFMNKPVRQKASYVRSFLMLIFMKNNLYEMCLFKYIRMWPHRLQNTWINNSGTWIDNSYDFLWTDNPCSLICDAFQILYKMSQKVLQTFP